MRIKIKPWRIRATVFGFWRITIDVPLDTIVTGITESLNSDELWEKATKALVSAGVPQKDAEKAVGLIRMYLLVEFAQAEEG